MVPDFYAMLEVEPHADRAAIESALEAKRRVWSSGTRNPKYKHTYQSFLDQIPEIRRCLISDPTSRAAYDAELAAARRAERDKKLDELQRLVKLRSAKGGLTVTDRSLLRDRTQSLGLEVADLERMIESIPPCPEAPPEEDIHEPVGAVLDPVMRRQIRSTLDHLRRRDLYDALGLPRDSPEIEIRRRTDEERDRWMRKSQVTAEKTAWLEVVSYAQSNLLDPGQRERYDRTLALEAEEIFGESVAFALEGLRSLDSGTRGILLDEAAARGIVADRAERMIARTCKAKGVSRDAFHHSSGASPPPRQIRCRECSALNDYVLASKVKEPTCRHCHAPLKWGCPSCQRSNWVDEPRCACRFPQEYSEPLIRHFEAAQKAHKDRDYEAARTHLQRVLEFAPGHTGARKGLRLIEERLSQISEARAVFDRARVRHRIMAARAALGVWGKLVAPRDPDLVVAQNELNELLREVLELTAKAKALEKSDSRAARAFYRRAVGIADDYPDAREGLLRCPPDPPSLLSAEYAGDRMLLRWSPPPPDDLGPISFVVIRKQGAVPRTLNDGQKLGQVSVSEFEDRDAPQGEQLAYAVYSVRGSVTSAEAACSPVVATLSEVSDVFLEARSHEVLITWSQPAKALGVRVYRREATGGPESVVEASETGLLDKGVQDDRAYRYRIVAIYKGGDSRTLETPGKEVIARPHKPVEPLAPPSVLVDAGSVILRWSPPLVGRVKIVRSARPLSIKVGSTVPASRLDGESLEWLDASRPEQAIDPQPPAYGLCYYTPLTFGPEGITVGHATPFSSVPDPSDLRAVRVGAGGRVHLRWRWSPRATECVVVAKAGSPPSGPDEPGAIVQPVLDGEYSRQGFAVLTLPFVPSGPWHLAVFTLAQTANGSLASPGLDPSARTVVPGPNPEVTLAYTLRRQGFPNKSWSVSFRTEPPGSTVPATVLVAHPRTVPLAPDDGEVVESFPPAVDGTSFAIKTKLDLARHRVRLFPDPNSNPDEQPPIRIRHPESTATRV